MSDAAAARPRAAQDFGDARRARRPRPRRRRRTACVVLIGASGSGKSTLLRCINLLETVDDGVIELEGRDITDPRIDADAVRARIGIVFQAFNLFPHLTRARQRHARAAQGARRRARARPRRGRWPMLERVGLRDKARRLPGPALRRPAAAGRDRPGPGQRPAC